MRLTSKAGEGLRREYYSPIQKRGEEESNLYLEKSRGKKRQLERKREKEEWAIFARQKNGRKKGKVRQIAERGKKPLGGRPVT